MVKKIILNDNEVVFNEDVSAAQDLRSLDLNSSLESIFQGTYKAGSSTPGAISAGAILSGLIVSGSSSNLSVNVSAGLAIFGFGGGDPSTDNRYRLASIEGDTNILLPVAHTTLHRWDLIEVSAEEVTLSETRNVLTSIGPTRALVPTLVPKVVSSNLKLRVRSGTPGTLDAARLPALQPSQSWLPIAAIRVTPSDMVAAGNQILDLRKMFDYCSPSTNPSVNQDGFRSAVQMSSAGSVVSAAQNWLHAGQYCSPIGTTPQQNTLNRPQIDVNVDKPVGLTLQVNVWYYIYAYRPNRNCGFCSMFLSSVAPNSTDGSTRGTPSSGLELPVPWPVSDLNSVAMYMGAVRLYDNGGTFFPLPFRKTGGYTSIAYASESGYSGADTQAKIHSAAGMSISPGATQTETINPDGDGLEAVPPHCRLVRVAFQFENTAASADPLGFSVKTNLSDPFFLYRVADIDPDHMVATVVDIPTDSGFSVGVSCTGPTPGDVGGWRAWVEGFYEEMP